MPAVPVVCPNCSQSLPLDIQSLGRKGCCPHCGHGFTVEAPDDSGGADTVPEGPDHTEMHFAAPPPGLPETFGRYRILKLLGEGGMGTVYLAKDTSLGRQVALKVIRFAAGDGSQAVQRFYREAEIVAGFDHSNLCRVYDVGQVDGKHFLTMPFIEGHTLKQVIDPTRPLTPRQAAGLVATMARALQEAHDRKIVHRDLKPANVMINPRGELVIMDFGLARRVDVGDEHLTQPQTILGTVAYMAPEQASGKAKEAGPACDIYSLGVILYELLTGRRPFVGTGNEVLGQILYTEPVPPSKLRRDLDPKLEAICLKALAKKPEDRYVTMSEFASVLDAWLQPASSDRGGWRPLHTALAAAAGTLALILGIILYVETGQGMVKIVVDDPTAVVRLDGKRRIFIEELDRPLKLNVGEHTLEVTYGALHVETRKFTVRRGDIDLVTVTYTPKKSQLPPPDVYVGPAQPGEKVAEGSTNSPQSETSPPVSSKGARKNVRPAVAFRYSKSIGMTFVRVPVGTFTMGSADSDSQADADEKPAHRVTIRKAFSLAETEVTQGQYQQVMGNNPSYFKGPDTLPVERVSWVDATRFCNALSQKEGLAEFYRIHGNEVEVIDWSGPGYRLPTEAEWEYACRGSPENTTRYSCGVDESRLGDHAWFDGNSGKKTQPVRAKMANAFGLYDMHGNVWEWCWDWYDKNYYKSPTAVDPKGPDRGTSRVFRGGSWIFIARDVRSASRDGYVPERRDWVVGFRPARTAE